MGAKKFIVLRGAPGSGKSTWIANNNLSDIAVSADDWRIRLFGIGTDENGKPCIPQCKQGLVWGKVFDDIKSRMEAGKDVILDACSLNKRDMKTYIPLCEEFGYDGYVIEFFREVDRKTAHERNMMRDEYKQVPDFVIDRFYDRVDSCEVPEFYKIVSSIDRAYDEIFDNQG